MGRFVSIGIAAAVAAPIPLVFISHGGAPATPTFTPLRVAREDCSTRSEANFVGGFTSRRNVVVGPLVLVGGAYTDAATVRKFGGNKFPLLVRAGHVVTLQLASSARRITGLAYGPQRPGPTRLRDAYQRVTFIACRPGPRPKRYSPDGPSGSYADGQAVTFWSGFVVTRRAMCVPLEVYLDGARSAQRVGLSLGRHCKA